MPRSTDLNSYTITYMELMDELITQDDPVRIPCKDKSEAENFRLKFYSFRKAYIAQMAKDASFRKTANPNAATVCVTLDKDITGPGYKVVFQHEENTDFDRRFDESLAAIRAARLNKDES